MTRSPLLFLLLLLLSMVSLCLSEQNPHYREEPFHYFKFIDEDISDHYINNDNDLQEGAVQSQLRFTPVDREEDEGGQVHYRFVRSLDGQGHYLNDNGGRHYYDLVNQEGHRRSRRNINELDDHDHGGHADTHLDADDPDFSGVVDFSQATPGPDGSWCITKTNFVDHMVKDDIKECWHQNVTSCHDTYVTEFLPSQEQKCEETFWKSCKIDFRDMPFNYSMRTCHAPLMKTCDADSAYGKPEIVCKTWFESECNTTFSETTPNVEDKPNTWCRKVPRKICAPDNCKMVPGPEQCTNKVLVDTVQKPTEICDLQPQQHCKLVTKLTPHLLSKEVCKEIPKEVCHLALSAPKNVRKPMTLKWCTKRKEDFSNSNSNNNNNIDQTYKASSSYLPPPPIRTGLNAPRSQPPPPPPPPSQQTQPPPQPQRTTTFTNSVSNFQVRNDDEGDNDEQEGQESVVVVVDSKTTPNANTKFHPAAAQAVKFSSPPVPAARPLPVTDVQVEPFPPVFQEQLKPAAAVKDRQGSQSIQLPEPFKAELERHGLLLETTPATTSTTTTTTTSQAVAAPVIGHVSITEDLTGEGAGGMEGEGGGGVGEGAEFATARNMPGSFFRKRR